MICQRCGRENEPDARFCTRCGIELAKVAAANQAEGEQFCYKHPKVATNLSCGRCGKPVCTKCVIIGPAGPRCPECGKGEKHFRSGAVWLNIKRAAGAPFRNWMTLLVFLMIIGAFSRLMGCGVRSYSDPTYEEEQMPDESSEPSE